MSRNEIIALLVVITIFVAAVSVLILKDIVSTPEAIEITILFTLVLVTIIYAKRTSDIAKATREQAKASVKIAKITNEQLLSEARPYLLLRLTNEYLQWEDNADSKVPREFLVTVCNAGKGPAINLSVSLWKHTDIFFVTTKGYLAANQEWEVSISKVSTDGIALGEEIPYPQLKDEIPRNRISVVVKYEDIHHREWVSYLLLDRHIDLPEYVADGEQKIVELKEND